MAADSDCGRVVLHLDLDCFYAQVEAKRLGLPPSTPLAVQQWSSLLAVSYSARPFGVKRGDRADAAKRACPALVLVHVETLRLDEEDDLERGTNTDMEGGKNTDAAHSAPPDAATTKVTLRRYREASAQIMAVLQRTVPCVERASIDEAYLDVTELVDARLQNGGGGGGASDEEEPEDERLQEARRESHVAGACGLEEHDLANRRLLAGAAICLQLRRAVAEELQFTVSGGVAHNKQLAKLASARNKPNKQTIVPWRGALDLLAALPLRAIRGLGGKTGDAVVAAVTAATKLPAEGLTALCLEQALRAHPAAFATQFDAKTLAWLLRVARGVDDEPVVPNLVPKSINCFKSFAATRDADAIVRWLHMLSSELAQRVLDDRALHARAPRLLVLHHRGVAQRSAAGRSENDSQRSRSCAMPAAPRAAPEEARAKYADAICDAAAALFRKGLPECLPCTRVAIGASDFSPLPPAGAGITRFFAAGTAAPGAAPSAAVPALLPAPAAAVQKAAEGLHRFFGGAQAAAPAAPDDAEWCARCMCSVPLAGRDEHADWHFAVELQRASAAPAPRSEARAAAPAAKRAKGSLAQLWAQPK